jgi:hypothetical protein
MKSPLAPAVMLLFSCIFSVNAEIENLWFRSFTPYSGRLGNFGEAITCVSNTLIVTSVAKDTVTSGLPVPMLTRYYSVFDPDSHLIWSTHSSPFYYEPPLHTLVDNSSCIITPGLNSLQRISLQGDSHSDINFKISDSFDYEISAAVQYGGSYFTGGSIRYAEAPPGIRMLCALVKRDSSSSTVLASIRSSGKSNCYIGMIAVSKDVIALSGTFGNPGDILSIDTVVLTAGSWYDRFVIMIDYHGHVQSIYVFDDNTYISNIAFDLNGDLYFGGGFYGSLSIGRLHVASKGGEDAFIVKVSKKRSEYWIRTWGGQSTDDHCSAFTFQNDSLIWASGSSSESINGFRKAESPSLFIGSLNKNSCIVKDDYFIPGSGRADGRGIACHENKLYVCGYYSGTIEPDNTSYSTKNNQFNMFVTAFNITSSSGNNLVQEPLVHHYPVYRVQNPGYVTLTGRHYTPPASLNRNADATSMIIRHNNSFHKLILNSGGGL